MTEHKKIEEPFQDENSSEAEMEKTGWDKRYKDDYLWSKNNPDDYDDYGM